MKLSAEQIKGRIRNIAKENGADARAIIRIFMMERFLERLSESKYRDNVIVKGGFLVTSLVGVSMRSTMDIDARIKNINLSIEDVTKMVKDVCSIDLDDGITFVIKDATTIMDEADYPGIRFIIDASIDKIQIPFKLDISTDDIITPAEVQHDYKLLLEDRYITLWSYNIETLLSEKIQTVLSRGILNTRMRDFYDIHAIQSIYAKRISYDILSNALVSTCEKRGTLNVLDESGKILQDISNDKIMQERWKVYQNKYDYASDTDFNEILLLINRLMDLIKTN